MTAQRPAPKPVDAAVLHYGLNLTQMKSGLVHLHLTHFVPSPRKMVTTCLEEQECGPLTNVGVVALLDRAWRLGRDRLTPTVHEQQLVLDLIEGML